MVIVGTALHPTMCAARCCKNRWGRALLPLGEECGCRDSCIFVCVGERRTQRELFYLIQEKDKILILVGLN